MSAAIATHLEGLLGAGGIAVTRAGVHGSRREDPEWRRLGEAINDADVVVLATPLYVDCLPAAVTEALEALARRRLASRPSPPRFLAIVNCGFPEAVHTDTALAICRLWAGAAGLDWIGGLAIGGGGMLEGRPLAALGGRARNVTRALDLAAEAVVRGAVVPDEALRLARTLAVPTWLYRVMGEWGFRRLPKRHGTRARLGERPYTS